MALLFRVRKPDGEAVEPEKDTHADKENSKDDSDDHAGADVGIFKRII